MKEFNVGDVVWEATKTKKLTIAEINALLGYEVEVVKE